MYDYLIGENFMFGSLGSQLIIVSFGTSEIRNSLQIHNRCSNWMEILMSCTIKNPNNKLWLCKDVRTFNRKKTLNLVKRKFTS